MDWRIAIPISKILNGYNFFRFGPVTPEIMR